MQREIEMNRKKAINKKRERELAIQREEMQRKKVRNKREKERNKRKKNSLSSGNPYTVKFMVLILDGSSLKDAPERRNLFYSNCLRHLIRSGAVTKWIF